MSTTTVRLLRASFNAGESPSAEHHYKVLHSEPIEDETTAYGEAYDAIVDGSPARVDIFNAGLYVPRRNISLVPLSETTWEAVVSYGTQNTPVANDSNPVAARRTEFEISTTTTRVTRSLATIASGGVDIENPGNIFRSLINVTKDGVQGTDIDTGTFEFAHTVTRPADEVTEEWLSTLARMVDEFPVNMDPFAGFEPGELRIRGARGSLRNDGQYDLTFRFAVKANTTSDNPITIGVTESDVPIFTITEKEGWDYLWVRYDAELDTRLKVLVEVPTYYAIERVYGRSNFYAILGIE